MEQNGQANNSTNEKQQEENLSQHTHVGEPTQATKDQAAHSGQANLRHDWTVNEIIELLETPLMDLVYQAQSIHRIYHPGGNVQLASLLSIKTGACPEDCKYCPQSAHYAKKTGLAKEPLMDIDDVLKKAEKAKDAGASRFCMGAAWREVRDDENFENVITMVKGVKDLGLEACVTLGMLSEGQAKRLADAGLTSYNHNIDTSEDFYSKIITTRTYEDRLNTINNVQKAGISLCSGGIIGLGESLKDRASMLQVLANLPEHPGSVPINTLVAVPGTPLEDQKQVDSIELVRMIATARILMPKARVRLSAGRESLNDEAQILCFMAGANSVFYGEKLLTTGNNDALADQTLIQKAGLGTD